MNLILRYAEKKSFSGNNIYKNEEGIYFEKDKLSGDIIYLGKNPDNEALGSIKNIKKYKDMKIITTGDENLPTDYEEFNYMMLSRLMSDCEYYLGNGGKHPQHLWAKDEEKHIKKMEDIFNSFPSSKRPEWLTMDKIKEYKAKMLFKPDVKEIVKNLQIKEINGLRFGRRDLYVETTGYAFFHKEMGYLAFEKDNRRRRVPIPYIPLGGKVALQSILDGGFANFEGIHWLRPLN